MGRGAYSRRDAHEPRHNRAGHRRKSSRFQRNDHLTLWRRRSWRTRDGEPAKDGLQKRSEHGWRLQSLESRRTTDDEIVIALQPAVVRYGNCLDKQWSLL